MPSQIASEPLFWGQGECWWWEILETVDWKSALLSPGLLLPQHGQLLPCLSPAASSSSYSKAHVKAPISPKGRANHCPPLPPAAVGCQGQSQLPLSQPDPHLFFLYLLPSALIPPGGLQRHSQSPGLHTPAFLEFLPSGAGLGKRDTDDGSPGLLGLQVMLCRKFNN